MFPFNFLDYSDNFNKENNEKSIIFAFDNSKKQYGKEKEYN